MGKAGTKKIVVAGIWLALLASLLVGFIVMGNHMNDAPSSPSNPSSNPMPKLTAPYIETLWPQVIAHAAAPPRGAANARYTLAEFGDFQCPQCGKVRPLLEKLLAQYPAQVNLIFIHRPIPSIHEWAFPAGQASEIAAAAGKFWPMYDVLYSHQDDLEPGFYPDYAAKAGMDRAAFQKAFDAGQGIDAMKASAAFADTTGIQETPTILVRDNVAKTVSIYVGMSTAGNVKSNVPFPGFSDLIAHPLWAK